MSTRLDEMNYEKVHTLYKQSFEKIIPKQTFDKISELYLGKYNELLKYKDKEYLPASSMGRGWKYIWNMLWGWYFEELLCESLKLNPNIKKIDVTGNDSNHKFLFDNEHKKVIVDGEKTTNPDFLIYWHDGKKTYVEIKTAASGIFTIKRGNVVELYRTMGFTGIYTLVIMIDLIKSKYSIYDIKYFHGMHPFVNNRMEGQLCYQLPDPDKEFANLKQDSWDDMVDTEMFNDPLVRKYRLLNEAVEIWNKNSNLSPNLKKIIKDKMSYDRKVDEFKYKQEIHEKELKHKLENNPDINNYTWEQLESEIRKLKKS